MPKRKLRRGLSEVSTDAKRKEARRGPAAEHSVQASLDPAGRTLDVEVATDISLGAYACMPCILWSTITWACAILLCNSQASSWQEREHVHTQ